MNRKAFTLIELLVVVAIIGILAVVGVTTFGGFQEKAKISATKANFKNAVKYLKVELMKCELDSTAKILNGLIDCNDRALVIAQNAGANGAKDFREKVGISLGKVFKSSKNPYNTNSDSISVQNYCDTDTMVGFVCVYYKGASSANFWLEACYKTPCPSHGGSTRNETNKLYAEIELY